MIRKITRSNMVFAGDRFKHELEALSGQRGLSKIAGRAQENNHTIAFQPG